MGTPVYRRRVKRLLAPALLRPSPVSAAVALPLHNNLTEAEVDAVVAALKAII